MTIKCIWMSWFNSLFSLNFGWCLVSVSRVPFFFINTDTKCRKQMFSRLSERQCLSSVVGAPNFISEKNCQHLLNFHCRYCSSEESPQKGFIRNVLKGINLKWAATSHLNVMFGNVHHFSHNSIFRKVHKSEPPELSCLWIRALAGSHNSAEAWEILL